MEQPYNSCDMTLWRTGDLCKHTYHTNVYSVPTTILVFFLQHANIIDSIIIFEDLLKTIENVILLLKLHKLLYISYFLCPWHVITYV